MDDLTRIERDYGSVAEYNRCQEEEDGRRYEEAARRERLYAENRKKISRYYDERLPSFAEAFDDVKACEGCETRSEILKANDNDDIGLFFCFNKECPIIKGPGKKSQLNRA